MVKYTVAASVALVQLAMFARTSVALPINPYGQQLSERDGGHIHMGTMLEGAAGAVLLGHAVDKGVHQEKNDGHVYMGTMLEGAAGAALLGHAVDKGIHQEKSTDGTTTTGQQRRDLSELDARDWEDFAERYFNDLLDRRDASNVQANDPPSKGRRDISDLYERDWDEHEKRSFNELEERDWDDYGMEARGLDFDELD